MHWEPLYRNNWSNEADKIKYYECQLVLLRTTAAVCAKTHQFEDFEEVQVGVQNVLDLLQPLLTHSAHGVADPVEAHAAGKNDESFKQGLAAGYVFQLKVRDTKGKLKNMEGEKVENWYVSKNLNVKAQKTLAAALANFTCSSRILALMSW